jgi:hypothetical protein
LCLRRRPSTGYPHSWTRYEARFPLSESDDSGWPGKRPSPKRQNRGWGAERRLLLRAAPETGRNACQAASGLRRGAFSGKRPCALSVIGFLC